MLSSGIQSVFSETPMCPHGIPQGAKYQYVVLLLSGRTGLLSVQRLKPKTQTLSSSTKKQVSLWGFQCRMILGASQSASLIPQHRHWFETLGLMALMRLSGLSK